MPKSGIPESFKVLVKELQALGLDFKVLSKDMEEIDLKETFEDDDDDFYDDKFRKKAESGVGVDEVFEELDDARNSNDSDDEDDDESDDYSDENIDDNIIDENESDFDDADIDPANDALYIGSEDEE